MKKYLPTMTYCLTCGGNLKHPGQGVSEQLELAPATNRPIKRGIACPDLLGHVLITKSVDYLPPRRIADCI